MKPRRITQDQAAAATQRMLGELERGEQLDTVELTRIANVESEDVHKILHALITIGAVDRVLRGRAPARFALPCFSNDLHPERRKDPPPPRWARSVFDYGQR